MSDWYWKTIKNMPTEKDEQELRPLLREARELAEHTAHYYDRRYIRREKYRI